VPECGGDEQVDEGVGRRPGVAADRDQAVGNAVHRAHQQFALGPEVSLVEVGRRSGLAVVAAAFFPLYFRKANEALGTRAFTNAELPLALTRWAGFHAARTAVVVIAFAVSVAAA
jgi:hypothetical protein